LDENRYGSTNTKTKSVAVKQLPTPLLYFDSWLQQYHTAHINDAVQTAIVPFVLLSL